MSNFPIFHGITLADNSFIENLNVEVLTADPVPVGPGRIWFNSDSKVFKFSSLNGSGGVIVRTFQDAESAQIALSSLKSDLEAADAAEAGSRIAGDASTLASAATYTDSAKAAAIAYIDQVKANILGGIPPAVLDTITELAAALKNNPDIVSVLESQIIDGLAAAKDELKGTVTAAMDTLGEIEVALNKEIADRATAISTETSARVGGDDALDTRLTTVEVAVNGKIGNLSTLHTDVKDTLVAAINEVQDEVVTEAGRASAAEVVLGTAVSTEATRAQGVEAGLQTSIETEAAARVAGDSAEAIARAAGDATLLSAVNAEAARAAAAEAAIQSSLDAEVAARTAADAAEVTARQAAVATVQANVEAEAAARAAAVTAEAAARTAADAVLQSALDAEVARAIAAEAAISVSQGAAVDLVRADYNGKRFTFQSVAAAATHIVAHNLNAPFVDFTVLVQRPDGTYRNDVVSVQEVDANTLKVYLSSAQLVKMSVSSMGSL